MSEFAFRNLSVKLFAAEGETQDECACCSYICQGDSQIACRDPSIPCGLACSNVATPVCNLNCSRTVSVACNLACSQLATPVCNLNCSNVPTIDPCNRRCSFEPTIGCYCSVAGAEPTKLLPPPEIGGGFRTGDIRAELAAQKQQLRQRLTEVEEHERRLEAAAKPRTIEEVEQVKSQLLAAAAELDELRAQMEAGRPQPE